MAETAQECCKRHVDALQPLLEAFRRDVEKYGYTAYIFTNLYDPKGKFDVGCVPTSQVAKRI